ncbi:hypothetical protein [Nocardioides sp.]|uniref:hypothetical protein n=1 Tax=Nocardioides sp. TaxID=35761 RepID=UPI00351645E9
MPKGGHARSGPPKQEGSRTSERAGYQLTALPADGYDGEIPDYPLPDATARELEVWETAWRTPMGCAWAGKPWFVRDVAMWCRWSVRMESEDASAALGNVVQRYADGIGWTHDGRQRLGWKIAEPKPVEAVPSPTATVTSIKGRLNRGSA